MCSLSGPCSLRNFYILVLGCHYFHLGVNKYTPLSGSSSSGLLYFSPENVHFGSLQISPGLLFGGPLKFCALDRCTRGPMEMKPLNLCRRPGLSMSVWGCAILRPVLLYCPLWHSCWKETGGWPNTTCPRNKNWRCSLTSLKTSLLPRMALLITSWTVTSQRLYGFRLHGMPTWTVGGIRLPTLGLFHKTCGFSAVPLSSLQSCAVRVQNHRQNGTTYWRGGFLGNQLRWRNGHWRTRLLWGRVHPVVFLASFCIPSARFQLSYQ